MNYEFWEAPETPKTIQDLNIILVAQQDIIAEDTTHLGCKLNRNQPGTKP